MLELINMMVKGGEKRRVKALILSFIYLSSNYYRSVNYKVHRGSGIIINNDVDINNYLHNTKSITSSL